MKPCLFSNFDQNERRVRPQWAIVLQNVSASEFIEILGRGWVTHSVSSCVNSPSAPSSICARSGEYSIHLRENLIKSSTMTQGLLLLSTSERLTSLSRRMASAEKRLRVRSVSIFCWIGILCESQFVQCWRRKTRTFEVKEMQLQTRRNSQVLELCEAGKRTVDFWLCDVTAQLFNGGVVKTPKTFDTFLHVA